mmetsp:Transcript_45788/g.33506  ORF Transcript_45788/g.33506 Transcript_45788/m.33506 type:complete len:110 (-) Transcript_45788:36-365(-)
MSSSKSRAVQKKLANRVNYLKFLAQNKQSFISDVALLATKDEQTHNGSDQELLLGTQQKMQKLLVLAEDPKLYQKAIEDFKDAQVDKGALAQDHLFEDKYIISDKTFKH